MLIYNVAYQDEVTINYVKLHAEPTEGKTLDISEFKTKFLLTYHIV